MIDAWDCAPRCCYPALSRIPATGRGTGHSLWARVLCVFRGIVSDGGARATLTVGSQVGDSAACPAPGGPNAGWSPTASGGSKRGEGQSHPRGWRTRAPGSQCTPSTGGGLLEMCQDILTINSNTAMLA